MFVHVFLNKVGNSARIVRFDDDPRRRAWGGLLKLMPAMFNFTTGYTGWVPAKYGTTDVVVVSMPIVRFSIQYSSPSMYSSQNDNVDVKALFESQWKFMKEKGVKVKEVGIDVHSDRFEDMILQTPFKPADRRRQSENASNFFVVQANEWTVFLEDVKATLHGEVAHFELTCAQEKALDRFGHAFSVLPFNTKPA